MFRFGLLLVCFGLGVLMGMAFISIFFVKFFSIKMLVIFTTYFVSLFVLMILRQIIIIEQNNLWGTYDEDPGFINTYFWDFR